MIWLFALACLQKIHRKDQTGKPKHASAAAAVDEEQELVPRAVFAVSVPAVEEALDFCTFPFQTLPSFPAAAKALTPSKLPAAALRALHAKRPAEYSYGYAEQAQTAKRHLTRMDAAEQAVNMLRHDLDALRADMQAQFNQLHSLVHACLSSVQSSSTVGILDAPEYQAAPDVDVWLGDASHVSDFSIPFEQHFLSTEETLTV